MNLVVFLFITTSRQIMQISHIGINFNRLWGLKKKQKSQEASKTSAFTSDYFEFQKILALGGFLFFREIPQKSLI